MTSVLALFTWLWAVFGFAPITDVPPQAQASQESAMPMPPPPPDDDDATDTESRRWFTIGSVSNGI